MGHGASFVESDESGASDCGIACHSRHPYLFGVGVLHFQTVNR